MLDPDTIQTVLTLYVSGMSVEEICDYAGLVPDAVNAILDTYAPFL